MTEEIVIEPEQTPQRFVVTGEWQFGTCKRCLKNDVNAGDIVVRITGKGWWHDPCFKIVRPEFYVGLEETNDVSREPRKKYQRYECAVDVDDNVVRELHEKWPTGKFVLGNVTLKPSGVTRITLAYTAHGANKTDVTRRLQRLGYGHLAVINGSTVELREE